MNFAIVFKKFSVIAVFLAILMVIPIPVALIYGEFYMIIPFLIPAVCLVAIGFGCSFIDDKNVLITQKTGFLIVGLSWLVMSLVGALPFWISGEVPSYIDALFETASGFSTTGATVIENVEALSKSLLFWRSFTHWIGGMGVLVFIMAIMPLSDSRSFQIMRAETPGQKKSKLVAKLRSTAMILYGIYIVLTVVEVILLLCGGLSFFDSITTAFATAGTGGFSVLNSGVSGYQSSYINIVLAVFMFLFGVNFNLYFFILLGDIKQIFKNSELKWFVSIVLVSAAVITLNTLNMFDNVGKAIETAFFYTTSFISTTGFTFAEVNINEWPILSQSILVLLMFIGGCAGSTGGGLKVGRVMTLIKTSARELRRMISPRRVSTVQEDGEPVSVEVLHGTAMYFCLYAVSLAAVVVLISVIPAENQTFAETFTAAVSCLNNIGPGLGRVMSNCAFFTPFSKLVLSFAMLAGRLELYPMLILFSVNAWKK